MVIPKPGLGFKIARAIFKTSTILKLVIGLKMASNMCAVSGRIFDISWHCVETKLQKNSVLLNLISLAAIMYILKRESPLFLPFFQLIFPKLGQN